jgi:hypothetical protein
VKTQYPGIEDLAEQYWENVRAIDPGRTNIHDAETDV